MSARVAPRRKDRADFDDCIGDASFLFSGLFSGLFTGLFTGLFASFWSVAACLAAVDCFNGVTDGTGQPIARFVGSKVK